MKTYILIGGKGFIGSHMVNYINSLPEASESKIIIIDPTSDNERNISVIKNLNQNIIFFNKKFEDIIEILFTYVKTKIDFNNTIEIHHLAAELGVSSIIESKNYFKNEINLSMSVSIFLNKLSTSFKKINFVYYSSSEVYGDLEYQNEKKTTETPSPEDDKFLRNRYNIFKTFGEYFFKDICDQLNINFLIIRPYNVIGIGQREEFVIPKMIKDAFKDKKITIYGSGDQVRLFIDVDDFCRISLEAIKMKENKKFDFTVLNVCNNSNYSNINKLAKIISEKVAYELKEDIKIEKIDNEIKVGQEKRIPDIERQYRILQLHPEKKLNEIINEYINWYKNLL